MHHAWVFDALLSKLTEAKGKFQGNLCPNFRFLLIWILFHLKYVFLIVHTFLIDEVEMILEEVQDIQKWSESKKESEGEVKSLTAILIFSTLISLHFLW